jgi:transcriptional pleiotropic regulator of transition state genes
MGGLLVKNCKTVRRVDELGRSILPAECRKELELSQRCPLQIYVEDGRIIIEKIEAAQPGNAK